MAEMQLYAIAVTRLTVIIVSPAVVTHNIFCMISYWFEILFLIAADLAEQEAIEKIDEVQNEIDRLNEQASEEILKVCVYVYALSLCSEGMFSIKVYAVALWLVLPTIQKCSLGHCSSFSFFGVLQLHV